MSDTIQKLTGLAAVDAELREAGYGDPDKQCDVIMKGGITSGVVYPLTVCKLATKYRLRSIGGASAGAIAAAVAAAAEHRRQRDGSDEGYRTLQSLPTEIAQRLQNLFQPMTGTRRFHRVMLKALDSEKGAARRWLGVIGAIIRQKFGWFLVGLLVALLISLPGLIVTTGFPLGVDEWRTIGVGLLLPMIAGAVLGSILAAVGFGRDLAKTLPDTRYGITNGTTPDDGDIKDNPALTDWLTDLIDDAAGIEVGVEHENRRGCLTLGDLWGPTVDGTAGPLHDSYQRIVDLQVMTTNLTLRRPYRLPFARKEFYFDPEEMAKLFPKRVVETMTRGVADDQRTQHPDNPEAWLYPFPCAGSFDQEGQAGPENLPLVVMARMSLSFPVLIAAVPLWGIGHDEDHERGQLVPMLFSDGGVSSNFPMHFFDSLLPSRPTFGINLAPVSADDPELIDLPRLTDPDVVAKRAYPIGSAVGFGTSLLDTMQNWADYKQVSQQGYADRVVEIRLNPEEGGMNLRMPEQLVMALAERGAEAGDALLGNGDWPGFDWESNRAVRYRVAMARLSQSLKNFRRAWEDGGDTPYRDFVASLGAESAPESEPKLDSKPKSESKSELPQILENYFDGDEWRAEDLQAVENLITALDAWADAGWPATSTDFPTPAPELRLTPQ